MREFVNEHIVELGLLNFIEEDLGENDRRVEESGGERGDYFVGDKKPRDARTAGVAQTLPKAPSQIRTGRPGAMKQATELEIAAHNSRE
jgi:hypothetical protein